jgi:7-cyano-7-deazaguanine synthase
MTSNKKAVVLVSGGLDSTTVLAIAHEKGFDCYALSFDYGQRHIAELNAASNIASKYQVKEHRIISLDLAQLGGSALTDTTIAVPKMPTEGIPVTYVPARNTLFLSYALAWAEVLKSQDIFIGVNAVDFSGYPDCRPEYISAYETMARLATKAGVEGSILTIHTPLITLSKSDIIKTGNQLSVDYSLTVSCYQADDQGRACGECDSCRFRKEGFISAGLDDPTLYQN